MKQTIIDLLKTKFEGVDESILSRIADTKAAKAVKTEDEANTFVEGVTLNQLLNSYGDIRSTEAQRTAVSNYEKKHGLKDGNKVDGGGHTEPADNNSEEMPAWAKKLMDDNKLLAEKIAAMNTEKLTATRQQRLDAVIARLPESNRKGYARTSFKELSDEEFDTMLSDIEGEVTDILKETKTNGATFGTPIHRAQGMRTPGVEEASKEEVQEVVRSWGA